MLSLPKHKMTVDEFLAWSEGLPKEAGRFELRDGEVIEKRGAGRDCPALEVDLTEVLAVV